MFWLKVFSAVLVANLVTGLIGLIFSVYLVAASLGISFTQAQVIMFGGYFGFGEPVTRSEFIDDELSRLTEESKEQARKARIERERRRNAERIERQTCNFWRQQYQDNPTEKNKAYRDTACSKI